MRAHIAFNRQISDAYRHLGLATPGFPETFGPGQFVMVRPALSADPFLPRAFSIYRIAPATPRDSPVVEILYKVLGKGTQCLSRMEPGQAIEILGPLGNHFTVDAGAAMRILVAGGIGVPPIAALARSLATGASPVFQRQSAHSGTRPRTPTEKAEPRTGDRGQGARGIAVFLGGKTADDILCVQDFADAGATVRITTEDGSLGTRGLITDLLAPFLLDTPGTRPDGRGAVLALFTCGPPGMLSAVARLAERVGVTCQTSVEANMACGFGACMGCAVQVRSDGPSPTYTLVCKDGPVFDSRVIAWD